MITATLTTLVRLWLKRFVVSLTLRMYASLLIDWEQRKTDYDHQMNEVNQLNQKMIGENRVPMKIGMSLPLPRPQ